MKTRNSFTALAFMVVVTLCTATVQAAIPAVERDALTALYDSTGGANLTDNTGWLGEPGTECSWLGVTCTESAESVIGIHLGSNRLTGAIPPAIGNLLRLESLDLSHNSLTGSIPPEIGNLAELQGLYLASNTLVGEIPTSLQGLVQLRNGVIDYNGLTASDVDLRHFLDRVYGPFWGSTQTITPERVTVDSVTDHTIWLTWESVTYDDPGGYQIFTAPAGSDSWTSATWTSNKTVITFPVTGLEPGTSYEFAVASFTNPHEFNDNRVVSETREPVMATTADLGCEAPTIVVDREDEIILSVDDTYDSYLWSTEETSPTLVVDPESPEWYWVTVTWDAGCEATASVLVRPEQLYVEQVEAE